MEIGFGKIINLFVLWFVGLVDLNHLTAPPSTGVVQEERLGLDIGIKFIKIVKLGLCAVSYFYDEGRPEGRLQLKRRMVEGELLALPLAHGAPS